MVKGTCKLCLRDNVELRDSHLVPKAMYKRTLARERSNPNPVVMTGRGTVQTSKQITDYVFCGDCEQRINREGERYALTMMARGGRFRLLELLEERNPDRRLDNNFDCYITNKLNLDREKLAYFGLSVLWRASTHVWKFSDGQEISIDLGKDYNQKLRLYLMGVALVPAEITMMVVTCSDGISQRGISLPGRGPKTEGSRPYRFGGCGLEFLYAVGNRIDPDTRAVSFIHSPQRWIFKRDCTDKILENYEKLMALQRDYKKKSGH